MLLRSSSASLFVVPRTTDSDHAFGNLAGFHSATWRDFIRQLDEISFGNLAGFNPRSSPTSRWPQGTSARRHGASRDRCRGCLPPRPGISAGLMQDREEPARSGRIMYGSTWFLMARYSILYWDRHCRCGFRRTRQWRMRQPGECGCLFLIANCCDKVSSMQYSVRTWIRIRSASMNDSYDGHAGLSTDA